MLKVGVLLGDNIGLEVVPEAVKVMKAAAAKTGLQLDWRPLPIGRKSHEASGHTMPPSTVDTVATLDGWLMGPIGHSLYPRNDPTWAKPDFRKGFDLFASVKPVKSYANIESLHKGVDIVFLREVTEGPQYSGVVVAGDGEFRPNDDISIGMRVVTRKCANRVARAALVGGLGLAPGLCVGERQAMAQAAHGSAPDIAGQGIANPFAMIMSGKMLLEWLGRKHSEDKAVSAAALIEAAMDKVIAEAKHVTGDLGGTASTSAMGDAIAAALA